MLSNLLKEHQTKQAIRKTNQEAKRKEAIESANCLTQALVDHLNVGVAQAYLNQKRLDAEAKLLHQSALTFAKQTQQWLSLVDNFNGALKEIGDVENWAKSMENDLRTISSALEYAYKGDGKIIKLVSTLRNLDAAPGVLHSGGTHHLLQLVQISDHPSANR